MRLILAVGLEVGQLDELVSREIETVVEIFANVMAYRWR
jgi:hypothetical protein